MVPMNARVWSAQLRRFISGSSTATLALQVSFSSSSGSSILLLPFSRLYGGGKPPPSSLPVASRPPPEPPDGGHTLPANPEAPPPPPEPPDLPVAWYYLLRVLTSEPLISLSLDVGRSPPTLTETNPPLPPPVPPDFNLPQSHHHTTWTDYVLCQHHLESYYRQFAPTVSTPTVPSPTTIDTWFSFESQKPVCSLPCPSLNVRCRATFTGFGPIVLWVFQYLCSEALFFTSCTIWWCSGDTPCDKGKFEHHGPRFGGCMQSMATGGEEDFRGISVFWLENTFETLMGLAHNDLSVIRVCGGGIGLGLICCVACWAFVYRIMW